MATRICVANAWQIAGKPQKPSPEHNLGKGEVDSSILSGSTMLTIEKHYVFPPDRQCSVFAEDSNKTRTWTEHGRNLRGKCMANHGRRSASVRPKFDLRANCC